MSMIDRFGLIGELVLLAVGLYVVYTQGKLVTLVLQSMFHLFLALAIVLIPVVGLVVAREMGRSNDPAHFVGTPFAALLYFSLAALFHSHGGNICLILWRDSRKFSCCRRNFLNTENLAEGSFQSDASIELELVEGPGKQRSFDKYYLVIKEDATLPGKRTLEFSKYEEAKSAREQIAAFLNGGKESSLEINQRPGLLGTYVFGLLGICYLLFGPKS
jgi:hypothetical protein